MQSSDEVAIQRSEFPLAEKLRAGLENLTSIANERYDFVDLNFKLGNLTPRFDEINYDHPEVRYKDPVIGGLLRTLDSHKCCDRPALYVFNLAGKQLPVGFSLNSLKEIKDRVKSEGAKLSPISSKSEIIVGSVLYVGVRQPGIGKEKKLSNISSRLIAHFGYGRQKARQCGLQLARWKQFPDLEINLRVHLLPRAGADFVVVYEKLYALSCDPVFGQHR